MYLTGTALIWSQRSENQPITSTPEELQDPDDDDDAGDPGGDPHESASARLPGQRRRDNT